MKPSLALLSLVGLAPAVLATDQRTQLLTYPAGYLSGAATQVCVGQFTDDTVADAAMLVGGNLVLSYAPERHASFVQAVGPFSAMTKVTLGSSGRSGLLVSTSSGLSLATWNEGTRQLALTSVYANGVWASARKLETICIGTSVEQICALSSSGNKVFSVDWNGSQIVTTTASTRVLSGPALAMAAVDWNGDALPDFAYDTGSGLQIISNSGAILYSYPNACTQPLLARLPVQGTKDDLAWITKNPAGPDQVLTVLHSMGNVLEPAISAGSMVLASMTLAQMDANSSWDLVLARSDAPYAQVLYHQSSGIYSFGLLGDGNAVPGLSLDLASVWASGSVPVFAAGDLDGDGDGDLYIAGQPAAVGKSEVWFGTAVCEDRFDNKFMKAWILWGEYVDWWYPDAPPAPAVDTACLTLEFRADSTWIAGSGSTDRRVTIWTRSSDPGNMQPLCLLDTFTPLASTFVNYTLPLPGDLGNGLPRYLVLDVSFVQRDANGNVLRSFPAWTGQIDRTVGLQHQYSAGSTTTGGIIRPPPPPTGGGSPPSP